MPRWSRPSRPMSAAPSLATPTMIAIRIQPIKSSRIADAMINCPRSRRANFISCTTIATILIEEIDSATARKSAVAIRRLVGQEFRREHEAE